MLPLLLLAAALSGSLLDWMALDADEAATVLYGSTDCGRTVNLTEVLATNIRENPDQAFGYPLLASLWARFTGCSEVALRTLSWLAGLLALAWTWRAGRDMYGPAVGLVAAGLMATSVLFVTYMAIARTFTLVVLFVVLTLYGYWRAALRPGPVRQLERLLLLAGCSALLYLHYFGALLVPALCLFHLAFVRRDRRQVRVMVVFLLAGLVFLPRRAPCWKDWPSTGPGRDWRNRRWRRTWQCHALSRCTATVWSTCCPRLLPYCLLSPQCLYYTARGNDGMLVADRTRSGCWCL